jgi:hypothetical protein
MKSQSKEDIDRFLGADSDAIRVAHDRVAPYWAAALVVFCTTGLLTINLDFGPLWKGYVLDATGPAWNYILFRLRFTAWVDNAWTRFFTPTRTLVIFILVSFGIEGMQFLGLYDSTFDPLDLIAYLSLLIPVYVVDRWIC